MLLANGHSKLAETMLAHSVITTCANMSQRNAYDVDRDLADVVVKAAAKFKDNLIINVIAEPVDNEYGGSK